MSMKRREFLVAGLALNFSSMATALAQQGGATPDRAGRGGGAVRAAGQRRPDRRRRPGCSNHPACIPTRWP